MKFKLYFFSNSDLNYKSIGRIRLLMAIALPIVLSCAITAYVMHDGLDPLGLESLLTLNMAHENQELKTRLVSMDQKLIDFQLDMKSFGNSDNQIRTAENLPPIPEDERKAAIGGVEINEDYGLSSDENGLLANATKSLELLEREARLEVSSYANISERYKSNQELFKHIPAIDPIRGGIVIDQFGLRLHPILHVLLMHQGVDIEAGPGTPVHATGDGVVSYVGRRGGYGNVVEIDNGFGYSTLFAHLEKQLITERQKVTRGQVVGLVGNTGLSTGPHLHYGVMKNGIYVNPEFYFFSGRDYNIDGLYDIIAARRNPSKGS